MAKLARQHREETAANTPMTSPPAMLPIRMRTDIRMASIREKDQI